MLEKEKWNRSAHWTDSHNIITFCVRIVKKKRWIHRPDYLLNWRRDRETSVFTGLPRLVLLQASCRFAVVSTVASIDSDILSSKIARFFAHFEVPRFSRLATKETKWMNFQRKIENWKHLLLKDLSTLLAEKYFVLYAADIQSSRLHVGGSIDGCTGQNSISIHWNISISRGRRRCWGVRSHSCWSFNVGQTLKSWFSKH